MPCALGVPHGAESAVPTIAAAQGEIDEGGSSTREGRKGRTADDNPRAGWRGSGIDSSKRRGGGRRHNRGRS